MRGEQNGMGWDGRIAEYVFKILPYIAHRTPHNRRIHKYLQAHIYIFMNYEMRKKIR